MALSGRLERLFQQSFPENPITEVEEQVPPLKCLLEPAEEPGVSPQGPEKKPRTTPPNGSVSPACIWVYPSERVVTCQLHSDSLNLATGVGVTHEMFSI